MPSWSPLSRRSIPAFKERDGSSRSTTSTLKDSKEEQLVSSLHSKASHSSHLLLPPRPPLQGRGNQFHPECKLLSHLFKALPYHVVVESARHQTPTPDLVNEPACQFLPQQSPSQQPPRRQRSRGSPSILSCQQPHTDSRTSQAPQTPCSQGGRRRMRELDRGSCGRS